MVTRISLLLAFAFAFAVGCSSSSSDISPISGDGGTIGDAPLPGDAPIPGDGGTLPDQPDGGGGGGGLPPDAPIARAPGTLENVVVLGAGKDFIDVTTDQGGNVWGVTASAVYFFPGGSGDGIAFDQTSGLAHGQTTWTDPYWFGTPESPSIQPVSFASVAGGLAGEAFVGNIGYIGDRLQIDPATGAVQSIVGVEVTSVQQMNPDELAAQKVREVSALHAVVDLNGPGNGATYFGGFHGTSTLRGMNLPHTTGTCGCFEYEEHVHPFGDASPYGGDPRGLAVTPEGDLWMGDRDALYFMPLGSLGPDTDFFQDALLGVPGRPAGSVIDVFPGGRDWTYGIALDAGGGIWVASMGNGLAYLSPGGYVPTYYSTDVLPSNDLNGVAVDPAGDVWIATHRNGVVRYAPGTGAWTYYFNSQSGLPSPDIRQVYLDKYATQGRRVLFATDNGIAIYSGP